MASNFDLSDPDKKFAFKGALFKHTSKTSNKKRAWRSLKQILATERTLSWTDDAVLCEIII